MANIAFLTGGTDVNGSGIGFYGSAGFGASVPVGSYNGRTYITNSAGSALGPEGNNIMWSHPGSGVLGQSGSGMPLTWIPNAQATMQIRFTHASAVKTQNTKIYAYDRVSVNNSPSGVTVKMAQLIHPNATQIAGGSGNSVWETPAGSSYMSLVASPGLNGTRPSGANTYDITHDHYVAISVSPDSVGSKTFGAYVSLEYLT